MSKPAHSARIKQFQADIKLLKEHGYTQEEIAKRMGTTSGYLSKCITGSKHPGEGIITRFNTAFNAELASIRDAEHQTQEPFRDFNKPDEREDHIQTLKVNNETLRNGFEGMLANNTRLTNSYDKLSNAQIELMNMLRQAFPPASAPNEEAKNQRQTGETKEE